VLIISSNRKAWHDYTVEETLEAGLVLLGTEVKSLRDGKVQLGDAYAAILNGETWLHNCHIPQYSNAAPTMNHNPDRVRKLLLNRREIDRLRRFIEQQGKTLIPLKLYFRAGKAKCELGLCTGKRKSDKREAIKERETMREADREMRSRSR